MSNIAVDFQELPQLTQSTVIKKLHLEQQFLAKRLLCENFVSIFDFAATGFEKTGKGVIVATPSEDGDDNNLSVRYQYIPVGNFIQKDDIEHEAPELIDWLLCFEPSREIVFCFLNHFTENCVIPSLNNLLVQNVPPISTWFRVPSGADKLDRQELINEVSRASIKKVNRQPEKTKEIELYEWLRIQGISAERQVKTSNHHRLDLWVPGKLMIELKAGKVSADDFCQAVDYYASYKRSVLLVGTSMTSSASRGIEAFNKAVGVDAVQFVTWSAVKPYLRGLFLSNSLDV